MLTSPQSGPEFENAIRETLVTGEELISFSNGWIHIDGAVPTGSLPSRYANAFQWTYLALTNINLRFGQWGYDHRSVWAEAIPTGAWGLDQISTYKSSTFPWIHYINHERPIANVLPMNPQVVEQIFMGIPFALGGGYFENRIGKNKKELRRIAQSGRLSVTALVIGLLNGDGDCFYSFFDELSTLAKNLEEIKSGALLASQATKAADALGVLTPLLQEGIITQEEFDRAKAGFLGTTTEAQKNSAGQIRQLHSLYRDGILSEGEFNMKKWDILSKN